MVPAFLFHGCFIIKAAHPEWVESNRTVTGERSSSFQMICVWKMTITEIAEKASCQGVNELIFIDSTATTVEHRLMKTQAGLLNVKWILSFASSAHLSTGTAYMFIFIFFHVSCSSQTPLLSTRTPQWGGLAPNVPSALLSRLQYRFLGKLSCLIWLVSKPNLDDVNN